MILTKLANPAGNVGEPTGIQNLPCYFPGKQGKERRDRFAADSTLDLPRLSRSLYAKPDKSRKFPDKPQRLGAISGS